MWECLQGHTDTVEDVVFQPGSSSELASVADDSSLLFWDTRSGIAPVLRMAEAHGASDLHVVDWSSLRPELVATGKACKWWRIVDASTLQTISFTVIAQGNLICTPWLCLL